jgi:ABC-type branched-subunit amino acid transport system substrate-binding protein
VEIGIGVDRNDTAFAAAFGTTVSQPEEKTVAGAVVADINQHGGLAGHPIVPVYTEFDNTSNDWIAQDQASCARFTQDHHVLSVVRNDDIFGPLDTCLANAGIPLVLYESYFRAPSWFRAVPGLRFVPDNPGPTRLYAALADRMAATHRWTAATKIGLVRYDRGDQAEIETQSVRPALAARGFGLAAAEAVHTPESFQDIGTTSGQMAAVVLRFRQAGVDNVLFEGGDLSYLFATAAESQQYAPRYALTSFDFPNAMPPDQLHGAFGTGWEPSDDLVTPLPITPGVQRCQQATRSTNAQYASAGIDRVYTTCDLLYFLQAAYNAAGDVGGSSLELGAKRLRATFAPAFTFAIDVSAHPDGAAAYRDLLFDEKCSCLVYGPQSPLP